MAQQQTEQYIPKPIPNNNRMESAAPVSRRSHVRKQFVLCFDGTGDQFDNDNSNIVQLFSLLKKGDKDQQLCYYQARILNSLLIT